MIAAAVLMLAFAGGPPADHQVAPGDLLRVTVVGNEDLSATPTVTKEGDLWLTPVGKIPVAGLTTDQVAQEIAKRLAARFVHPQYVEVAVVPPALPGSKQRLRAGAVVPLFDTLESMGACYSARLVDLRVRSQAELEAAREGSPVAAPKETAGEVCEAGTIVKLAPRTQVAVIKANATGHAIQVTVTSGKNAGKEGWVTLEDLEPDPGESK